MIVTDRARRGIRTALTVALSVATVLLAIVPVIVTAVEPLQEHLPGGWYLWLVGIAGTIVAVATAVQRILTSDVVEKLLQARAPSLAAAPVGGDGAAVITDLPLAGIIGTAVLVSLDPDERTTLASVRDALDEGDLGRTALDRILT